MICISRFAHPNPKCDFLSLCQILKMNEFSNWISFSWNRSSQAKGLMNAMFHFRKRTEDSFRTTGLTARQTRGYTRYVSWSFGLHKRGKVRSIWDMQKDSCFNFLLRITHCSGISRLWPSIVKRQKYFDSLYLILFILYPKLLKNDHAENFDFLGTYYKYSHKIHGYHTVYWKITLSKRLIMNFQKHLLLSIWV